MSGVLLEPIPALRGRKVDRHPGQVTSLSQKGHIIHSENESNSSFTTLQYYVSSNSVGGGKYLTLLLKNLKKTPVTADNRQTH